jgi:long-subunit acyl-CoA synthetase (AMP-forming)/alkylation response protein AidB-like acyl-CoA dehydrogenase
MNPLDAETTVADARAAAPRPDRSEGASSPSGEPAAVDSLAGLLAARAAASPDRPAIAVADGDAVTTWTWLELAAVAVRGAEHLEAAGLCRGDRLAHVGSHSAEWFVIDLACLLAGIVHLPLHAGAAAADHREQLGWLEPRGLVTSGLLPGGRLSGWAKEGSGRVAVPPPPGGWLQGDRPDQQLVQAALTARCVATDPDACCTIVLSSGTTGQPHGVLHSQRTLLANTRAVSTVFLDDPRDVRLAWLPASHLLARVGDLYTAIERGGCLNVVADRTTILAACRAVPPTVILGVPAFFERLEAGVRAGRIHDLAVALGGEVRVCVSGGAPLRWRTADFFAARGVPLVEGYGLAEAGPVVSLSNPRIHRPGTVGPPLAGVQVRLDERPESRGQLLVRTPARALAVIDADGAAPPLPEWLETGDLATLDEAGHLRITGRLKDVIVLPNGQKIPPVEIERAIAEDEAVAQVCVVGDGHRWPVAVIVPEPTVIRQAIRRLGLVVFSRARALRHPRLLAWLGRRLARRQRQLPRVWRVRRLTLVSRAFDAAHGETTESLKLRRDAIAAHFADAVSAAEDPTPRRHVGQQASDAIGPAVWAGREGGFATAAELAATPLDSTVEAVLERATTEIHHLRQQGHLYEEPAGGRSPQPPIDDSPPPARGKFSAAAETAIGETGLWGLAVPTAFGGSGASMLDLARAITAVAADAPAAAGMLAVHSSIGAVSAIAAFGTPDQQARHLPGLAAGRPLSIFGATEPDAGCDLGRVQATLERQGDRLLLSGTKMFITGARHGRLAKVLARLDDRPAVVLAHLPERDTTTFRLRHYQLHPLKQTHNAALEFDRFEVSEADLLEPPGGDAMAIVWHGLNRGRTTLAAQAAGTLQLLLSHAAAFAHERETWGRPIATRQLVQGRLGRITAAAFACEAISQWAAAAVDAGGGEWEAIIAKVTASTAVREAAIDALGIHGGRAFLVGHPLGDAWHDHFAVGVYEGESDLLGLALFRGLAKGHPLAALARDDGRLRRAAAWLAWRAGDWSRGSHRDDTAILDRRLRAHARRSRRLLAGAALEIDRAIRRHGRGLGERQLEIGSLAAVVRELASILAVAHHADASGDERAVAAADVWCRLAAARASGRRLAADDLQAIAAVGAGA